MRRPEPWYWAARKGWYVQIAGKQKLLGKDPEPRVNKTGNFVLPEEVARAYYRTMAVGGMAPERDRYGLTVAEAADLFVESKAGCRATTVRHKRYYVQKLVDAVPAARRLCDVKVADVERAAESYAAKWSPATRRDFTVISVGLFNWAHRSGYLQVNPFVGYRCRHPKGVRTRGMTDAEFWALVDHARDPEFKRVMQFLRATGCRPGEAFAVEARHVHPVRPVVVLPPEMHKTGGRTGSPRVIRMPKAVDEMVRSLCAEHPKGPVFRNSQNGGPWAPSSLARRVRRYRKALGLADDVVPYLLRHAAVTRLLDSGTDLARAAKIVGHAGAEVTQSVYYHPDELLIMADVEKSYQAGVRPEGG